MHQVLFGKHTKANFNLHLKGKFMTYLIFGIEKLPLLFKILPTWDNFALQMEKVRQFLNGNPGPLELTINISQKPKMGQKQNCKEHLSVCFTSF